MQQYIKDWLDTNLEDLVDTSLYNNDKYMPCYIKPEDLLADHRAYLLVYFIIIYYFLFIILIIKFRR